MATIHENARVWLKNRPEVQEVLLPLIGTDGESEIANDIAEESGFPFQTLIAALADVNPAAAVAFDLVVTPDC